MLKNYTNKSVMTHQFSQVPKAEIPRSSFDRSHGYKTTFDAGYLIPFLIDEALPGDTFNVRAHAVARLATPIFPIMDNIVLDTHFFAVPIRLIWDNWAKFNGEQRNPGDSVDFTVPTLETTHAAYAAGSLHDYLGIPTGVTNLKVSALWHRAYNLIYNEWYRSQDLQDSVTVNTDDGPDPASDYALLRRGKRHDYFTSCLPFPQKADAVSIPLGTEAPVNLSTLPGRAQVIVNAGTRALDPAANLSVNAAGSIKNDNSGAAQLLDPYNSLYADLSNASAATINTLRQAFQLQKMFERDARSGTRYTELVRSHFGVTSPDARLQRPEYLGGGSTPVNISPIPQTGGTGTAADTPQGNLAAVGTAVIGGHGFTSSFTEHCIILGLVSARADLTYQQGLNRMFSRSTRFDFYWPALSHIGEQAVLQQEIYATGVDADDTKVFGYQERYAEYRYKPSVITGQFRSNFAQSLDPWHLSQEFGSAPVLDDTFIVENPPLDRCIAVPSEPHFLFDSYIQMRCARPMPTYGIPGLIDHF